MAVLSLQPFLGFMVESSVGDIHLIEDVIDGTLFLPDGLHSLQSAHVHFKEFHLLCTNAP